MPRHSQPGSRHHGWSGWARLIEGGATWLLVAAVALTGVLGFGLTRLRFSSSQDTMVSSSSKIYRDNLRYQGAFGGEVMIVIFQGDVRQLATSANRAQLAALEAKLGATGGFHSIVGPDTALTYAAAQLPLAGPLSLAALARDQASAASVARASVAAKGGSIADQSAAATQATAALSDAFTARTAGDAARLATVGAQSLDNPRFVEFLIFDDRGRIRPSLTGAFPDATHALLVLRLKGNMTIEAQGRAAGDVTRFTRAAHFAGFSVMATGSAALLKEVNDTMRSGMARTGLLAVGVMALLLLYLFRARWRLLVLPLVLLGILWAFGAVGYLGIPLTMVTISGLPILIGLGVDFAIQVHARYEEERGFADGAPLERALAGVGPALTVAMIAAVVGFTALRISPVPMIRQFGVLLGVGAAVLLLSVLVWVPVVLALRDRRRAAAPSAGARAWGRRLGVERVVHGLTSGTGTHPAVVVVLSLLIASAGLVAQRHIPVQSDPEKFVSQSSPVLADLRHLRDVAGTSADLGLMVESPSVRSPAVLAWMATYEQRELAKHPGQLLSSNSIASITRQVTGSAPTPGDVAAVMGVAPRDVASMFESPDGTRAQMLFSLGHLSLGEQATLLKQMNSDLDPPAGTTVTASGLTVVGIAAVRDMQRGQATMTYGALLAILLWLLVWFRDLRKAFAILLPVMTAVGASAGVIYLLGLQISMLGALSSALVIAICTEFSVLILTRYEEERARGQSPDAAISTASLRIGRAFTVSGLTTAGGFAVLAFSGFPLLSSFGAIVAVNVLVAMVCALVIVPPLLRWVSRSSVSPAVPEADVQLRAAS